MAELKETLPLDTKLLGDAVIELNISRHNVSIYPRNHPIVERSLDHAYELFLKLFELKNDITLAVAKDTLIIDSCQMDQQNPVYRDFALCLSRKNIVSATFIKGITREELYSFHKFLFEDLEGLSSEEIRSAFGEYGFRHISLELIDFNMFSLSEGGPANDEKPPHLWELYVFGLLEGRLMAEDPGGELQKVSPHELAAYINTVSLADRKDVNYDNVITSYVRKTSERRFSGGDLKKIMTIINNLRPDLKRQFLSSAMSSMSSDDAIHECLGEMSSDDVVEMLELINDQMLIIPEALKNVLDKFSQMKKTDTGYMNYGNGLIEDDILFSPEITNLLSDANFKTYVSETYGQEIQKILKSDTPIISGDWCREFLGDTDSEQIDRIFSDIILELLMSDQRELMTGNDGEAIARIINDQGMHFVETGQFEQILKILKVLEPLHGERTGAGFTSGMIEHFHSPDFISALINSIKLMGRGAREGVFQLCGHYGEKLLVPLMEALIEEESVAVRRFLISLIGSYGENASREAANRLSDGRWYVQRNMLFILQECGGNEHLRRARRCCDHMNPRVSFEAIKCLLKAGEEYGVLSLKKYLRSGNGDLVKKAALLSGANRVPEVVPDLIALLEKKAVTGADLEDKIPIVKALGQIGDQRAREALDRVLGARTLLFRGSLERLKAEVSAALRQLSSQSMDGETGPMPDSGENWYE